MSMILQSLKIYMKPVKKKKNSGNNTRQKAQKYFTNKLGSTAQYLENLMRNT